LQAYAGNVPMPLSSHVKIILRARPNIKWDKDRQVNDLPDELWTKISIEFYKDPADAVFKALME
jgi:predicted ATP-dependent Lon-type protease